MTLRTKFHATVLSMLLCIALMSFGIYASMVGYSASVSNTLNLQDHNIQGQLVGERYGAGYYDICGYSKNSVGEDDRILFANNNINIENMENFTRNVSFAPGSTRMEYILCFIRPSSATTDTWITLKNINLSENDYLNATYQYGFAPSEPNWSKATSIGGTTIRVDQAHPCVWIRCSLYVKEEYKNSIFTLNDVVWTYQLVFEGVGAQV